MPPLVSIAIPCHNAERWIEGAIQSALAQSWPQKEVLVVDDGSTDRSRGVLEKFAGAIRVEYADHGGANHARNLLRNAARGEWIQYLDADDYLRPQKIERQFYEADPASADIIYSPVLVERWSEGAPSQPEQEPLNAGADLATQFFRWQLPQTSGALWRRSALEAIGGWDENPAQLCDEHDCYFRAIKAGLRFAFAPTANAVYRHWSDQTRSQSRSREVIASRTMLCESLRDWLRSRGEWKPCHARALGQSLFEMARSLAARDLRSAAEYHAARKGHICPQGPAAPATYRLVYRTLGFTAAELLARALRS